MLIDSEIWMVSVGIGGMRIDWLAIKWCEGSLYSSKRTLVSWYTYDICVWHLPLRGSAASESNNLKTMPDSAFLQYVKTICRLEGVSQEKTVAS